MIVLFSVFRRYDTSFTIDSELSSHAVQIFKFFNLIASLRPKNSVLFAQQVHIIFLSLWLESVDLMLN